MFKEQKQSSKLLKPRSFNTCKNAAAPMIVMLDCSEIDTEILDTDIETTEFNDYREVSGDNRDTNNVLAAI